jgi:hypothetical protein
MRSLFLNLLLLAAFVLWGVAAWVVAPALGLAVAGLACVVVYVALSDGKGIKS